MVTLPGELDQRVTIQTEGSKVPDGMGGYSGQWEAVATVWAKVRAGKGVEKAGAAQTDNAVPYTVTIRFRDGITAQMRLVWRGRALNIVNVADEGMRREWLQLDCMAGVAV